jgi:hypothetical protein
MNSRDQGQAIARDRGEVLTGREIWANASGGEPMPRRGDPDNEQNMWEEG